MMKLDDLLAKEFNYCRLWYS